MLQTTKSVPIELVFDEIMIGNLRINTEVRLSGRAILPDDLPDQPPSPEANVAAKRWFNKKEAAEYAGVSARTIDNWRAEGLVAMVYNKSIVRFDVMDLDAFLTRRKQKLTAENLVA